MYVGIGGNGEGGSLIALKLEPSNVPPITERLTPTAVAALPASPNKLPSAVKPAIKPPAMMPVMPKVKTADSISRLPRRVQPR